MDQQFSFFDLPTVDNSEIKVQNEQRCITLANESGHIPARFKDARFNDKTVEQAAIIKSFCLDPEDNVCILSGPCGNGKTFLSCAAMHERAVNGLSAGEYVSCRTLKQRIKSTYSFASKVTEMDLYTHYASVPFLILDEVGKCTDAQLEWDFVTTIIALRYDNELPLLITTNFTFGQFKDFIVTANGAGSDIFDRLNSVKIAVGFNSESLRNR